MNAFCKSYRELEEAREALDKAGRPAGNMYLDGAFDVYQLKKHMQLTRELIQAEARFKEARYEAKNIGLEVMASDQSSG